MTVQDTVPMNRRDLFTLIGRVAGTAVMYQAMESLAFAAESTFDQRFALSGAPRGSTVLVLGAGLAGMVAAYELRRAGYKVQVLEYQNRAGGRNWSLYGGDTYTELGGFTQNVRFDRGLYLNPGPWRIPHHHHGILHYAKLFGVQLQPFIQTNYAAYVHSTRAFGGKPQRFRAIKADYEGKVAELLAKTTQQGRLDQGVTKEDQEILMASLRQWGALDENFRYAKSEDTSERRGFDRPPGGGLSGAPMPSDPLDFSEVLKSRLWGAISQSNQMNEQMTMFQPVGGMGMIGRKFGEALKGLIRFNAKVTKIAQDESGVTATYVDAAKGGAPQTVKADWCVCTIPASILSQVDADFSPPMRVAINALPYQASAKVGLQFRRRFWEQDDGIYGGISYTDQQIGMISYPSTDYFSSGKGVLLAAYTFGPGAVEFTSLSPEQRIARAVEMGANIHPQYRTEYESGATVAWHRVPWTLGCFGGWTEATREQHYKTMCAVDGRIVLAGEHVSHIPAWQEGAVTSAIDAITRLHQRILQG